MTWHVAYGPVVCGRCGTTVPAGQPLASVGDAGLVRCAA